MKKQKTLYPSLAGRLIMINDLPDVLLAEILARVHSYRCAISCKLVCKQWYFLISCPNFVSRFLANHAQNDHHQKHSLIGLSVGGRLRRRQDWCIRFIGSQDLESAWTHSTSKNFDEKSHIVVYDPSGAGSEKRLCDFPAVENCWGTGTRLVRLGVCRGSLRMMGTFFSQNNFPGRVFTLCVWEILMDEEDGGHHGKVIIWRLKHSIRSNQMSSQNSRLQSTPKSEIKLLEFDPVDEEIVYLGFCDCIVSCNLTTGNLEVVLEAPSHFRRYPGGSTSRGVSNKVFPVAHPLWPAPLFS
ncbi:hypothetical protein Tsubulata_018295 [Turnera subulata]|uniref:F-box domain-containing protein n=1 Tax=Turnera subulata TaxID=218843 RepID=A0A9Q0G7K9_9ROSI|nr:hypothetical protein Tsubulata_018295 [Turnera subulata]